MTQCANLYWSVLQQRVAAHSGESASGMGAGGKRSLGAQLAAINKV
jgi:hypothetical protein